MVALAGYFDESSDQSPGILAVAGYVGPVEMWDAAFTPAWRQMLEAAPHPLTEYKHSDCRHGTGEFAAPWTKEERTALTTQAVDTIIEYGRRGLVIGLGVGLLVNYAAMESDEKRDAFARFAYGWCTTMICHNALRFAAPFMGDDDPLQLIFDERKDLHNRVSIGFGLSLKFMPEVRDRIRWPHFAPSHILAPLQAADLLAYETRKELKNGMERPPRKVSTALRRLVEHSQHFANYDTLPSVWEFAQRWERGEVPQGVMVEPPVIYDWRRTPPIRTDP